MAFHVDRFWRYAVDEIIPIEGHPEIMCEGSMMDLAQPNLDLGADDDKTRTPQSYDKVLALIVMSSACEDLLTFHRRGWARHPISNVAGAGAELQSEFSCPRVQWRYYRYFQLAYPGCRFYGNGNAHVIAVRQNGLVGMVMPLNPLNEWLQRKPSDSYTAVFTVLPWGQEDADAATPARAITLGVLLTVMREASQRG